MLGNKQITLRELYDTLGLLVEQYGDRLVVSEGCDCNGDVGGVTLRDDTIYLHRVDNRRSVDLAEIAGAKEEAERRAAEAETLRRRLLDADAEIRNRPRDGLTLDSL